MIQSDKNSCARRDFLKHAGRIAAASALAGVSIPHVHAAENNLLRVALIGCGGRGAGAVENCLSSNDRVKLITVADAFADNARNCLGAAEDRRHCPQDRRPRRARIRRFRRLPAGDRRRSRYRVPRYPAQFSSDSLCGRDTGGKTRLHGEALLRRLRPASVP